jgi:hypothetical protein
MGRWARSLTSWGLRVASVKRQLRDANSVFVMRAVSRIVAPRYGLGLVLRNVVTFVISDSAFERWNVCRHVLDGAQLTGPRRKAAYWLTPARYPRTVRETTDLRMPRLIHLMLGVLVGD